ncbi:MAG: RimK family alpha-L-glutamate ligase [Bdellovibrio sp.]|nr:RimK family alpha-L-glutamate ligase [Bdellovibrio sp.]
MRNLKILLLSRKFDIYSSRRLVEEGQKRSHSVYLWDPAWPINRLQVQPDIIIPRVASFQFKEAMSVLNTLEQRSRVILNASQYYSVARNKWLTFQALSRADIPTPPSVLNLSEANFDFPLIAKELESSKGEGVFLVNSKADLEIRHKKSGTLLLQEAYPECFGTDIRAFVVGEEIAATMKRTAKPGEFRSNLALGATAEPCEISEHEKQIILKTAQTLNLQVCGVDLLRTRKGSLVLEANPCPGLEGIEKYTKKNLAESIIKYAEELYDKHSSPR